MTGSKQDFQLMIFSAAAAVLAPMCLALGGFAQSQGGQQPSTLPQVSDKTQVRIPDGTAVQVVVKNSLSSESAKKDDLLELVVAEPVIVNGVTVIKAGTVARGMVVQAKKATEKKDGLLAWTPKDVSGADGALVPLRLLKMPGPGGKKITGGDVGLTALGIALLPLAATAPEFWEGLFDGLFQRGGQGPQGRTAEVPAGERFLVFVNGDVTMATKGAPLSEARVSESPTAPAITATEETPKPLERWSFQAFDPSVQDKSAQLLSAIRKAAADGCRLVAACDKGLLLEKVARPPDLYRYRVLPNSPLYDAELVQAFLNQCGALGYRWWHNTRGEASWDESYCVMEKAPGRPNQFQYICPPAPGVFGSSVSTKRVAQVNQWFAETYREGFVGGYHVPFRGAVMERVAEVTAPPMLEQLDPAEPYLWLTELLPQQLTPDARVALENLRGVDFEKSSRKLVPEIQAAAARGYRVVHCGKLLSCDCLLANAVRPTGGIYEYEFRAVEPADLKTLAATLTEIAAKGFRLHSVVRELHSSWSGTQVLDVLLEKDPQAKDRYAYDVLMDKTSEGLLGAMNAVAEQSYALRMFACTTQPPKDGRPGWFAIMEKALH